MSQQQSPTREIFMTAERFKSVRALEVAEALKGKGNKGSTKADRENPKHPAYEYEVLDTKQHRALFAS